MVLAVNRAVAAGARAVVCASTGNTSASAAAYAAAAGLPCHVILPAGKVARGKLAQALAAGARLTMVDGNFDAALMAVRRARRGRAGGRRQLDQPGPARGSADGRVGGRRRPRPRAGCAGAAGRQRRQHHGLLARVPPLRGRGTGREPAADARLPGRRRGADRARGAGRVAGDGRHRDPDRQPGVMGGRGRGAGRVGRADRGGHRRRDPRGAADGRSARRGLLRAGLGGGRRRRAAARRPRAASVRRRRSSASSPATGSRIRTRSRRRRAP